MGLGSGVDLVEVARLRICVEGAEGAEWVGQVEHLG